MLTCIFSAPPAIPKEAAHAALEALHNREALGLVLATDKPGCQHILSWREFMGLAQVKVKKQKYGAAAQSLAHCTAIIHYNPDIALICPGQKEEADLMARCIDADIPVVLFNFNGTLNETLTKKALSKWARKSQ